MSNGIGLEALEDYVKRQKKRLKTEDRNARKERGRQLRQPLAVWFLFIPRLSRVTFRAGRSSRTSWSRGARGSRYSGSAIFSGWAGRARGSRWSLKASCQSDRSHAQNEQGFNSHLGLQLHRGKSDAYWTR